MPAPSYCAEHSQTETKLTCGKCETAICPLCMVHAPVGVRCRSCAKMKPLPTFEVGRGYMTRAIVAGVILAVAGSRIVSLILAFVVRLPYLNFIALLGLGYLIGEGISLVVNRKRGRTLRYVAGGSVLLAYTIMAFFGLTVSLLGLLALALSAYVAVNRL